MKEPRRLGNQAHFWENEATFIKAIFTRTMSPEEWTTFGNCFQKSSKDFKSYLEGNLEHLISDIQEKKVDKRMNIKEASHFFAVVNCRFIDKKIRCTLYDLVYPDFIKNLIEDIQKGKVGELTLEEGVGLMRIIECNLLEENLRTQSSNFFYPRIIKPLIDNIQEGKVDELELGDVWSLIRLMGIIKCDSIGEELRKQLHQFVFPRMIKTLIYSIQEGILEVDEISWGDLKVIQILIDSDVNPKECSILCTLIYGGDERNAFIYGADERNERE